jgi:excisionase family DNA binding protein
VGEGQDTTQDKVTIQEAARRLGVKEDAVRKRIQRKSMRHEKAEDGRVYVWVDAAQDTTRDTGQTTQDAYQDTAQDERAEDLREQVGYLRRQLDEEREARRRADTIIAQLARTTEEQARTIRELEAPASPEAPEAPEAAETVEEASDRAEPRPATAETQEGVQRPWWRRVFGL